MVQVIVCKCCGKPAEYESQEVHQGWDVHEQSMEVVNRYRWAFCKCCHQKIILNP